MRFIVDTQLPKSLSDFSKWKGFDSIHTIELPEKNKIKDKWINQRSILEDRIVIKQLDAEEKTAGGIILPETAKEKPQIGKIVAVGPGKILESGKKSKMAVKKNDEVIYAKYMGNDIEIDGENYVILRESDILGIVEK